MKTPVALFALALALSAAQPASAQEAVVPLVAAPAVDPDATLVEELVVTARLPGPAWWRVTKGDSVVYVLGSPSLAPERMQWDRSIFENRLKGANAVILPYRGLRVKVLGAPGAMIAYMKLKSSKHFEDTLPPDLRARFVAVREKIGQPAKRYGTKNPLAAGIMLGGDYREASDLTDSDPTKLIRYLAQQAGVKVEQRTYDAGPLLRGLVKTSHAGGMACLEEVLAEAEAGSAATRAAAKSWAEGDVRAALNAERSYERCLNSATGAEAFDTRAIKDQADAIAEALNKPGHSIALVQLRPLLRKGGVLDRLRSQGYEIKTPGDL